jgi:hypothetical protein
VFEFMTNLKATDRLTGIFSTIAARDARFVASDHNLAAIAQFERSNPALLGSGFEAREATENRRESESEAHGR